MKLSCVVRPVLAVAWLAGPSLARAQVSGHHAHPPMPDQKFFFTCRYDEGGEAHVLETPLFLASPATAAELDQQITLPGPLTPFRLTRYLPRAERRQRVEPQSGSNAKPAVQVLLEGPTQTHRLWLLADDPERNRLSSLIGTWRYMSVADQEQRAELFEQWKTELTRDPLLIISRPDGTGRRELAGKLGAVHELEELGCTLRIKSFFPNFTFDRESGKPVNQSDKRLNPAVLVELESRGKNEERWIFAKFPDFKSQGEEQLAYRLTLDCALETKRPTPDFVLVTIARQTHEVWVRHEGAATSRSLDVDQRVDVPGSQYNFQFAQFVPAGKLIEEYESSDGKGAAPALKIETAPGTEGSDTLWLEVGQERTVTLPAGRVVVSFGPRPAAPVDEHKSAASHPSP